MSELVLPFGMLADLIACLTNARPTTSGCHRALCPVCGADSLIVRRKDWYLSIRCLRDASGCPSNRMHRALLDLGLEQTGSDPAAREVDLPSMPVGAFLGKFNQPLPHVVQDLIPDKSLLLLTGKSKFAKSLLGIDILDAICQGQPVFGSLKVNKPGPVLYLAMEDGCYELADRFRRRGLRPGDDRRIHICTERRILSEPVNQARLITQTRKLAPVVVLVDTAREALAIKDWSNASEIADKIRPIRDFARRHVTVILVAHNRKAPGEDGDEISGCNALTSSVDGWLSCFRKDHLPDGGLRIFIRKEGRGGLRGELSVDMSPADLHFKLTSPTAEPADPQLLRYRSALARIDANDGLATAPWIGRQLGISPRASQTLLAALHDREWLEDSGDRTGPTRRTTVYRLTPAGKCECA